MSVRSQIGQLPNGNSNVLLEIRNKSPTFSASKESFDEAWELPAVDKFVPPSTERTVIFPPVVLPITLIGGMNPEAFGNTLGRG
jgi:hypothetical protein